MKLSLFLNYSSFAELFLLFGRDICFNYNFGVNIIIIHGRLKLMMVLIHELSPRIQLLLHWILVVVLLADVDLRLVVDVELRAFALVRLHAVRLLVEATGASRMAMLSNLLLLTLSHLQKWVDVEPWRVRHHEEAIFIAELLIGGNHGQA